MNQMEELKRDGRNLQQSLSAEHGHTPEIPKESSRSHSTKSRSQRHFVKVGMSPISKKSQMCPPNVVSPPSAGVRLMPFHPQEAPAPDRSSGEVTADNKSATCQRNSQHVVLSNISGDSPASTSPSISIDNLNGRTPIYQEV